MQGWPVRDGRIARCISLVVRALRACIGAPDYAAYVAHCRAHHPDRAPASRADFHREREARRYARGRSRCC